MSNRTRRRIWRNVLGIVFVGLASCVTCSLASDGGSAETSALQADKMLTEGLAKGDRGQVSSLLDSNFSWINADGRTRTKAESLQNVDEFSADSKGDMEVQTHNFGDVERVLGTHHGERFVRLWVKRPVGWRAFIILETTIPDEGYSNRPSRPNGNDCENPCRELPYKPMTAGQQAAMKTWMTLKMDEWHALKDDWPKHVSETMIDFSPRMSMNKQGRLDLLTKQYEAYKDGSPGEAVESMKMFDFGDAVIMIAIHSPKTPSGDPACVVRMFVKESGDWKIALSAQTSIRQEKP
jgi:hypothetical protein